MHTSKYKYVSIVSAVAVLLLLGIYMWMTYRSVTKDIEERAGNQLMWAMFYESYTRADLVTAEDTLSLPQSRGNLSLASSVEGMNDALSRKYHSELSLDNVAMYVDSLLSVVRINRDVTVQEVELDDESGRMDGVRWKVVRQNNERSSSWSMMTKPVSIRRDQSRAIRLALNNPYPELARRLSPLFMISAIILGFFAVIIIQLLRFITEQEQMVELRNDFSYAMVHDMKSPLSSIIMGAHFLHSGKVDDKPQIKEKYYTIIEDEAEHLLALVNKLLTISKLENKKLILNKWNIYIEPIINDLVEKAKVKATKPIEVNISLEVKNVLADEQYLTEAIANLIDNALKYSKDEIELSIKTFDTDKYVLLKVRDNGIGMTKEEQQVIFDKFGRAAIHEKNRKGGVSGFGLGLNYVDQVMQAHGGKVTVSSEKDKFSEFTLYIPKETHKTHSIHDKITLG
jgi:two-component system phosphate regulon sensor histidine kinase PhoR